MAETANGMNRRRFLTVLGVTGGGAAVLSGCSTDKVEKLIPYIVPPENQVPGIATWYATTCRECPAGCGLHVRVREGRAVKVEGNPDHPVNRGRLCARGQASLQGLYNPDRIRAPMARTVEGTYEPVTWDDAVARIASRLGEVDGAHIRFVTGAESGSFGTLVREWLAAYGSRGHLAFEPFAYEALRHAGRTVFGVDTVPRYDFGVARYVLSFGADFLETFGSPVSQARQFAGSHGYGAEGMGRYVHVEPRLSMTAMSADEWVSPNPGTEALVALAVAHVIVRDRLAAQPADAGRVRTLLDRYAPETVAEATGVAADTVERLAREFAASPGVALAGGVGAQHEAAHATAHAAALLNYLAGNVGRTVFYDRESPAPPATYADVAALVGAMRDGVVAAVFVHGANPVHGTPPSLGFVEAFRAVPFKVSFARFMDETAAECDLILPDHDPLEQWNDDVPRAGVRSLQQPVMRPVFDTRQTGDVLLDIVGRRTAVPATLAVATYKDYLQQAWMRLQREFGDRRPFEAFWTEALRAGGVWWEVPVRTLSLAPTAGAAPERDRWLPADGSMALVAYPSATLYDGRGANRPWLQELPDPVTKITWTTWVELHPDTAAEHGIAEGDIVELTAAEGSLRLPAYLYHGLHRNVVAVPMGQGHAAFGRYAEGRGANVLALLPGRSTAFGGVSTYASVTLRHTGEHEFLPKTEGVPRQLGRGIARAVPLAELGDEGEGAHAGGHAAPVPERIEEVLDHWQEGQDEATKHGNYEGALPRWGMAVDLSRCTGCSACVTACAAENNLPTVGPEQVRRGREMSWIRIERYFEVGEHGGPFEARVVPMMCQQCSSAPCEPVCPVFAAYHTPDGLNGQIYNRCVGTRYCSNNCPYKVRYFNYFDYQAAADPAFAWPEPLHWLLNPDVTVRSKGVMEKCTFCVQRIRDRQHQAKLQKRERLEDGEIVTACQQTCPAEAIVFGDLNDPGSRVARLARDQRGYHVLGDLNTRPAVTYLEKVRNLVEA